MLRVKRYRIPKSQLPRIHHGPMPTKKIETAPLSNQQLRKFLPIKNQVKEQLRQAQIIKFSQLVKCLDHCNSEELLDALEEVGIMVQGNWLLQSSFLYQKTFKSSYGVDRVHILHAYYQMLKKFEVKTEVTHGEMEVLTQLPASDVTEILNIFAKPIKQTEKKEGHWVMKLPKDDNFIAMYKHREKIFKLLDEKLWAHEKKSLSAIKYGCIKKTPKPQIIKTKGKNNYLIKQSIINTSETNNKKLLKFSESMDEKSTRRQQPKKKETTNKGNENNVTKSKFSGSKKLAVKKEHTSPLVTKQIKPALVIKEDTKIRNCHTKKQQRLDSTKRMKNDKPDTKGKAESKNQPQAAQRINTDHSITKTANKNCEQQAKEEKKIKPTLNHEKTVIKETKSKFTSRQQSETDNKTTKLHLGKCKITDTNGNGNKESKMKSSSKLEERLFLQSQIDKLFECDKIVYCSTKKQPSNIEVTDPSDKSTLISRKVKIATSSGNVTSIQAYCRNDIVKSKDIKKSNKYTSWTKCCESHQS